MSREIEFWSFTDNMACSGEARVKVNHDKLIVEVCGGAWVDICARVIVQYDKIVIEYPKWWKKKPEELPTPWSQQ